MITKKVERKPENDDYRALAYYVGAADHEDEKLLYKWHSGGITDEFDLAIREVEATQDLNTTSKKEKTYHLLVSVRPEDESKLTPEIWQDIEQSFAVALGFEEHQRHCGVHKNTANLHMHVAYNMIHPQTYKRHAPYYDYPKRDRVCRELEKRYGLVVDVKDQENEHSPEPKRGNDKARTIEAHTGQQSFDGYIQERKDILQAGLAKTESWEDLHTLLANHGLKILFKGTNGCEIKDIHERRKSYAAKASSVGRQFSKGALEKRFGPYTPPGKEKYVVAEQYTAKPMQRNPDRDNLYQEYLDGMAERRKRLARIDADKAKALEQAKKLWAGRKEEINLSNRLVLKHKVELLDSARRKEREAFDLVRKDVATKKTAVRESIPYTNWADFLRMKAKSGHQVALDILQSRKQEVNSGSQASPVNHAGGQEHVGKTDIWKKHIQDIRNNSALNKDHRRMLIAVAKMYQLQAKEAEILPAGYRVLENFTYKVDSKGTVIFDLASGGRIQDNGQEIHYSADADTREIGEQYARLRFGSRTKDEGNRIVFTKEALKQNQRAGLQR